MLIDSHFKPAWWAKNPHVQTILADLLTRRRPLDCQRERLELADGDFVDLAWTSCPPPDYQGRLVVLFHGLEGSLHSHYAYRLMKSMAKRGWPAVMMHFRGCSGEPNRRHRSYHSGETGDARYLLETLKQRYPGATLQAVGYSLGGNMLLKYLGEYGDDSLLHSAVAVSPPLDLAACGERLEQGFSRLYQYYLLRRMKRNLHRKLEQLPQLAAITGCGNNPGQLKTFRDFDHQVTAPLHGFDGADDYYQRCSAMPFLRQITIPTLVIHAADDPFMTRAVIPVSEDLAPAVDYELSHRGGHVGFISGRRPWRPRFYLEQRVADFFVRQLPCNLE